MHRAPIALALVVFASVPVLAQGTPRSAAEIRRLHAENDSLRRVIAGLRSGGVQQTVGQSSSDVLKRLESYQAPPFPVIGNVTAETYDYRIRDGVAVPSKTMAFVVDVCTLITAEIDNTFKPQLATSDDVRGGINLYLSRPWEQIPGLRPWTHSSFVKGLSDDERARLSTEITSILRSGRITPKECQ